MLQDLERLWNTWDGNNSLLAPYLRKKGPLKGVWQPICCRWRPGCAGLRQILFFRSDEPCQVSYADRKGKFQKQQGIVLPRL